MHRIIQYNVELFKFKQNLKHLKTEMLQNESVNRALQDPNNMRSFEAHNTPRDPRALPTPGDLEHSKGNHEESKLLERPDDHEDYDGPANPRLSDLVYVKRSDYITPLELHYMQQKIMKPLDTAGLFGLDTIKVDKSKVLQRPVDPIAIGQSNQEFLKKDGIFLPRSELSLPLVNIQRMEQRLLREDKKEWFRKDDANLIMETEIFEERLTTMREGQTRENPNLALFKKNAYLSERQNQKKSHYFKLDINIGKVTLTNHPLFGEEDHKAVELKKLVREYKEKTDIALIPHLRKQLEQLNQEYHRLSLSNDTPYKEIEMMEKEIKMNQALLQNEISETQTLVEKIYKTWEEIKKIRQTTNMSTTTVRLNVREYRSEEGTNEIDLFLSHQDCSKVTDFQNRPIHSNERNRRQRITQTRVYIRIKINDTYAARTRKQYIDWPSFEVNFLEKFQIYLFTKPASIKFEVVMGTFREQSIDVIDIDIPGDTVNTLTSASIIYREKDFSKKIVTSKTVHHNLPLTSDGKTADSVTDPNAPKSGDAHSTGTVPNPNDKTPTTPKKGSQTTSTIEKETKTPISGIINYKAEWYGFGPNLPPPSIDKFGRSKQEGIKMKRPLDEHLDAMIDLNDPRNELLISKLKELKNVQIQEILKQDAMIPMSNAESLRQRLLKMRMQKFAWSKIQVPLLENEIAENEDLVRLIGEYEEEVKKIDDDTKIDSGPLVLSKLGEVDKFPESADTKTRIRAFKKKVFQRLAEHKVDQKDNSSHLPLKTIVKEFYFDEETNPFAEFFRQVFRQRGRFRPQKKALPKVTISERVKKTEINIHVIRGTNVPVRDKAVSIVNYLKQGGFNPNFQFRSSNFPPMNAPGYPPSYPGQDPYGGSPGMYPGQGGYGGYPGAGGYPGPGGYPGQGGSPGYPGQGGYMGNSGYDNYGQIGPHSMDYNSRSLVSRMADQTRMAFNAGNLGDNQETDRVLPYIEIQLYDPETEDRVYIRKTETFEGISPEWNDNLVIPFQALSDEGFKIPDLAHNRCILYVTLFDMVGNIEKGGEGSNKFAINIEKRYLGSFSIPLQTIFDNPKMEAQFKVERPLFLFGYLGMRANIFDDDPRQQQQTNPFLPTYVSLALSLNPVIEIPKKDYADFYGGGEDPSLLMKGTTFIRNLRENLQHSGRYVRLWAELINKSGKLESKFIPRYICALKPPIEPIDEEAYIKSARYVSLIPFKSDTEMFKDIPDNWCLSQEFLDLKAGDHEEHAILLCNYFNYIDEALKKKNWKNYILLGKGVPEGNTVYVLRKNASTQEVEIWNAVTGEPYYFKKILQYSTCCGLNCMQHWTVDRNVSDTICPLQQIGCIINEENIWANVQDAVSPQTVNFDLEKDQYWQPFMDNSSEKLKKMYLHTGKFETIQPELVYDQTPIEFVQRLEKKVEAEIAKRIEKIRAVLDKGNRAYRTKWAYNFGSKVRNILLVSFEAFKYRTRLTGSKADSEISNATMKSIQDIQRIKDDILNEVPPGEDIYGFPLNMPYTDIDKIWQDVKHTDIHNIQNDDVEYVLSVAINPYPHFVLSVWVYVGVIFKKPIK